MEPLTIEDLETNLVELNVLLTQHFNDLIYASTPSSIGELKLAINNTERTIKYTEGKINEYKTRLGILSTFYITVITGKKARVKRHLGPNLYNMLVPSRHDDNSLESWVPFDNSVNGGGTIKAILTSLKQDGYSIDIYFVEGCNDKNLITKRMNVPKNNIAIIDLLAMDSENETTISIFDHQDIISLLIPENNELNIKIREFVRSLSVKFSQFRTPNIHFLQYDTFVTKPIIKERIERLLKQYRPITNSINLPVRDYRLMNLKTGFN